MATRKRSSSPSFSRHVAPFAPLVLALAVGAASNRGQPSTTSEPQEIAEAGFSQICTTPNFPTDTPISNGQHQLFGIGQRWCGNVAKRSEEQLLCRRFNDPN